MGGYNWGGGLWVGGYNWRGLEAGELMSVRLRYLGFNFFKRLAGRAGPNRPTWRM